MEKLGAWLDAGKTAFSVVGFLIAAVWTFAMTFPTAKVVDKAIAAEAKTREDGDARLEKEVEQSAEQAQNNQKQILTAIENLNRRIDRAFGGRRNDRGN